MFQILLSRSASKRCDQKDFSQFSYSNWKLKGGNLSQRSVLEFTRGEVSSILFQLTMDKHSGMTGQQRTKKIQIVVGWPLIPIVIFDDFTSYFA